MSENPLKTVRHIITTLPDALKDLAPGVISCTTVAVAAQFLSEHYGAPAMLMALLLGIAFHFLAEEGKTVSGIDFTSGTVLRIGVGLLGVRMSVDLLLGIGWQTIILIIAGVIGTIAFGLLLGRLLGRDWQFALLTGGAVAICGASAAMAISTILPRSEHQQRNLIFTVIGVTVLSTAAMIGYPMLLGVLGFNDHASGIFIGATIHDVAQVVGAGFSISEDAGETATLVKLIRVTLLAPVILVISLVLRSVVAAQNVSGKRPPLLPAFVIGFVLLVVLNSFDLLPVSLVSILSDLSRWALLFGIAAVGMKTSLRNMLEIGPAAIALITLETLFLAGFVTVILGWMQ